MADMGLGILPEHLLLEIFKHLPLKDLCIVGRVCRTWRRVVSDNSLWRHVDLRPYKINLQRMWKVIRSHFSDVLLSLKLRGYAEPASVNWRKHSLSDAMLRELQERCPNLGELDLVWTSVEGVSLRTLPAALHSLRITRSVVPLGWFRDVHECGCQATLVTLDLSESSRISDDDVKNICQFVSLRSVCLNSCYRVGPAGLQALSEHLGATLRHLEIAKTRCSDLALHHIGRGLSALETLNVSDCQGVTDAGLADISATLKNLNKLQTTDCQNVTDAVVRHLKKLKCLTHCDLRRTSVTQNSLDELITALPHCDVVSLELENK